MPVSSSLLLCRKEISLQACKGPITRNTMENSNFTLLVWAGSLAQSVSSAAVVGNLLVSSESGAAVVACCIYLLNGLVGIGMIPADPTALTPFSPSVLYNNIKREMTRIVQLLVKMHIFFTQKFLWITWKYDPGANSGWFSFNAPTYKLCGIHLNEIEL